jgi:hypothetical protein
MSSTRSKRRIRAVASSNGSSSTNSRTIVASGALTIVWPVRASPNASSG